MKNILIYNNTKQGDIMRTVQSKLDLFSTNEESSRLRTLVEKRKALKEELDKVSTLEDFGGLRRMTIVSQMDDLDEEIIKLANLKVSHHSMSGVVVNNFVEGMI